MSVLYCIMRDISLGEDGSLSRMRTNLALLNLIPSLSKVLNDIKDNRSCECHVYLSTVIQHHRNNHLKINTCIMPRHPCALQNRKIVQSKLIDIVEVHDAGIVVVLYKGSYLSIYLNESLVLTWPGNKVRSNCVG